MASWLVRSTSERAVWVRALAGDSVLCSWARHFTLTVPLSTQVYKWVPAICWENQFDNIFTNKVNENIISGNIISDISDHFSQFCLTSSLVVKGTPNRPLARDFSKFSEENCIHDLSRIDYVTDIIVTRDCVTYVIVTFDQYLFVFSFHPCELSV